MAEKCPKCNRKLTLLDWRQNCPECGTNLMFHGFEERFYEDAKYSEMGLAKVRVRWAKVLACLFGGKLQIARLICILLPVAALLLPFCKLHIQLPLYSSDINLSLLGIISAFSDSTLKTVFSLSDAVVTGEIASALAGVFVTLGGALLAAALIIVFQLLCFLGTKVMSALLCAASALGAGFAVFGIFAASNLSDKAAGFESLFTFSRGFGQLVLLATFITLFVLNLIVAKKGIEIKYREGDLYRVETAKKLKRGEIKLADLPQPIFETEEERAERLKAIEDTVNGVSPEDDKKEDDEK